MGVLVLGGVSFGLIAFAYKTKLQLNADLAKHHFALYKAERSDDIQRQAEATLLAEKMKKEEGP